MSTHKTLFSILPNEIIYYIFEYLPIFDIIQCFFQLNFRYTNLVEHYVKQIDLTDIKPINEIILKQIHKTIEKIKIDRYNIDLLINYQYPRLNSLILVNVINWENILYKLNLEKLEICFDDNEVNRCYQNDRTLPLSLTRFSSNVLLTKNYYHENLIDLNININGIIRLIEIIEKTPNLQRLSAHFNVLFSIHYHQNNDEINRFEIITNKFQRLTKLNYLSLTNKCPVYYTLTNEHFIFDQIRIFLDRCCSDRTILKKVNFQFHRINFTENLWSTIEFYKNTFEQFHFYISFLFNSNCSQLEDSIFLNNQLASHIENGQRNSWNIFQQYIHVYSLPFVFTKLYGFNRCSQLNPQCSFASVRQIYTTESCQNFDFSFESLNERMPNIISIDYRLHETHQCRRNLSQIKIINDHFSKLRHFQFKLNYCSCRCFYYHQSYQLLRNTTNLKTLRTTCTIFFQINYPLTSIRKLHLFSCKCISVDSLSKQVPNLSVLLLTELIPKISSVSSIIYSIFKQYLNPFVLSLQISEQYHDIAEPYKKLTKQLVHEVKFWNDKRFQHLEFNLVDGRMEFSQKQTYSIK